MPEVSGNPNLSGCNITPLGDGSMMVDCPPDLWPLLDLILGEDWI